MKLNFALVCLTCLLFSCYYCQPPKGGQPHRRGRKKFGEEPLKLMKDHCANSDHKCKGQSDHAKGHRDTIRRHMRGTSKKSGKTDADIDRQLDKMYKAKKALLVEQGLNDIDPKDNGVFGGDMLLSEEQADRVIKRARGERDASDTAPDENSGSADGDEPPPDRTTTSGYREGGGETGNSEETSWQPLPGNRWDSGDHPRWNNGYGKGRGRGRGRGKRAAALSLDTYVRNRWPSATINYYADKKVFSESEVQLIRRALDSIQSKTCVKYVESSDTPYIEYLKTDSDTDPGTCGWAYMGYQGRYNPVHINFDSRVCAPTILGVIAHETLHTLGLSHEHTRYDRDKYLEINWRNVDPQAIDIFDKDDPYDVNPFCVPYDFESVMHYDAYVGARNSRSPTARPKSSDVERLLKVMGNANKPSDNDLLLVKKLYCTPSTCKDTNPYCGFSCDSCQAKYARSCPKSCSSSTCPITV